MTSAQFRKTVWDFYKKNGRHDLPWRNLPAGRQELHNPYRILVSEVMLQQTQVERVIPYYKAWLKQFPTSRALACAPLGDVLKVWQGLGYNRRGKALHEAAKIITSPNSLHTTPNNPRSNLGFPRTKEELVKLPGVGPYTAGAVLSFAYNTDSIVIETNIRTVVTHHFFPDSLQVADSEILAVLEKVHPKGKSREWYWALMDYGSYLKRSGVKINNKAKGYTKQSTFKGSLREVRGSILKTLAQGSSTKARLSKLLPERSEQLEQSLNDLSAEGLIQKNGSRYQLPQ